jgi:hypothetical protein
VIARCHTIGFASSDANSAPHLIGALIVITPVRLLVVLLFTVTLLFFLNPLIILPLLLYRRLLLPVAV